MYSWADVLQGARQRFGAGPSEGQGRGGGRGVIRSDETSVMS